MKEMMVPARLEELERVIAFVNRQLEGRNCSSRDVMQIEIAVEEQFVNIVNYAYASGEDGIVVIRCRVKEEQPEIVIQFLDDGKPYNPLERRDPDIEKGPDEREPGGLGVFMMKNIMDHISYAYENGQNILTLTKLLTGGE